MKTFKCNCDFHIIDCDKRPLKSGTDYIGLTIYEHRSSDTGKIYKNPIELGTVVLIGKEAKAFRKYMNE